MIYEEAAINVVSMCSDADSFLRLIRAGLNEELFVGIDPDERRIFAFTRDWFMRDGTVPTAKRLEEDFPQFFKTRLIPTESEEQPEYVVKVLKNNAVKVRIQVITEETVKRIFNEDADQVEELAQTHREVSDLYMAVSKTGHSLLMSEAAPQVVKAILNRAEDQQTYREGLVKFPFTTLDDYYMGLRPRELAVFFGYTGDMKSLTVEYGSLQNALAGRRVAHFTFENGIETSTSRMLAMLTGLPMAKVSEGTLTPKEREYLRETEDELKKLPILIDESPGVSERSVEAVFSKARSYEAELVVIDQANWITSSEAKYKDLWANLAAITRKIQEHTNEIGVVTFLAAQANRESQKTKKGTGLAHIAGTDELTKTASYAISLDFDENTNLLLCSVVKARGGKKGLKFTMDIQLDTQTRIQPNGLVT